MRQHGRWMTPWIASGGRGIIGGTLLQCLIGFPAWGQTAPVFLPSASYPANAGPYYAAVGDFNADGLPDIAISNHLSQTVTVLLQEPGGGFVAGTTLATAPVANGPRVVAVADFDRDGNPDLAVASDNGSQPGVVSVFPGMGSGAFGPRRDRSVVTASRALATGDMNADGYPDLITCSADGGEISVLFGDGAGGFPGSGIADGAGLGCINVAIADFNGDSHADVVASFAESGHGSILLGDGSGVLSRAAVSPFSVGDRPLGVAVGDFNGDGKQDVAFSRSPSGTVSVFLGDGAGGMGAGGSFPAGSQPGEAGLAAGDLNGDGRLDLAVANSGAADISVLTGDGSGAFSPPASFGVGTAPRSIVLADLNGDSHLDIAVANATSNDVSVLINGTVVADAPLVFVHGWCGAATTWDPMIRNLQMRDPIRYGPVGTAASIYYDYRAWNRLEAVRVINWSSDTRAFLVVHTNWLATGASATDAELFDPQAVADVPIQEKAFQLREAVNEIRRIVGTPKAIVVGHSQGGLVARAYVEGVADSRDAGPIPYERDVAKLITIDTPHQGSPLAYLGLYERMCLTSSTVSRTQMLPGSDLLTLLNGLDVASDVEILSIASQSRLCPGAGDGIVSYDSQNMKAIQRYRNPSNILLLDNPFRSINCLFQHNVAVTTAVTSARVDAYLRGIGNPTLEGPPARISVNDIVVGGPLLGATVDFRLELSRPSTQAITVTYEAEGGRVFGNTATFPPGSTAQIARVFVMRPRRTTRVVLRLEHPMNALLADAEAVATATPAPQ